MKKLKINEQIAFLRKQNEMTQEELAYALGVSNQAVSKWESAQCCPDIQLLPELAKLFEVSIDELMGYKAADASKDLILQVRNRIEELPKGEDFDFTTRMATALHTIIFSKHLTDANENPGWDTDDALKHSGNGEWGYSGFNIPELTTTMRRGCVFFSNNKDFGLWGAQIRQIASVLKSFSDVKNIRVAYSIYLLTKNNKNLYISAEKIAQACSLTEVVVNSCLDNALLPYLTEQEEGDMMLYRFKDMYMNVIPLLSMFGWH